MTRNAQDPDGQAGREIYGPKQTILMKLREIKMTIARLEKAVHSQEVIINDATRSAVFEEYIKMLESEAAEHSYEAAYGGKGHETREATAEALRNRVAFLRDHGWVSKFLTDGEPKAPDLPMLIDNAYIQNGAHGVIEFWRKNGGR